MLTKFSQPASFREGEGEGLGGRSWAGEGSRNKNYEFFRQIAYVSSFLPTPPNISVQLVH